MPFHTLPTEQRGHYRYDPTSLHYQGPARLFPYVGEDGVLRYVMQQLRHNMLEYGKLSQPWSLLLQQLESLTKKFDEGIIQIATLMADTEIFQSGWFNFNLPPEQQFNAVFVRERREMGQILLAAREAAQSVTPATSSSVSDRAQQQRDQFYAAMEHHGRSRPVLSRLYERDGLLGDREFARQRLAGQNPMVIRRIQPGDQPLLQTWATQAHALSNGTIDLIQAAGENRLFLADYPLLRDLTSADLQPGRYVGSPIALFYRHNHALEPVLIQVEPGRVVTPQAGSDEWMRAKLYVQTADVTHHELIAHLCYTHLAMEAFAIATPRQIPANHPVYRLLIPHFQFLLAINTRGNAVLLGEGAAIDNLMAPTRPVSLGMINRAYRERPFMDYALPTDIQQRGIEPKFLPEFPYRDDAVLLWEAISRYVTHYLQRYYPNDQAVQQDRYLQAWAEELGAPLNSRPITDFPQAPDWLPTEWLSETGLRLEQLPSYARVPDFPSAERPGELTSLQQLIDIATIIIFTCGPQHAAVNFSQFDYVGYTPNAPFATYSYPDTPASLEQLLPPPALDLGQMELSFALSGIHYGQLGSSDQIQFTDAGDRQVLKQFQAELVNIEEKINARNQERVANTGLAYPYLLPSEIPNSINI
jgi:arachidonate 15-lipoxygenase